MNNMTRAAFRLSLLGRFELTGPDGNVDLGSKKLAGLLAYLACTAPEPQGRERLKTLFWGSHFEEQAKQNLRKALSRLRGELGDDLLVTDGEKVSLAPQSIDSDVTRFESLAREGSSTALSEAMRIYRGPLLADLAISDEAWEEWVKTQRQRLENLALDSMVRLADQELQANDAEAALAAANRALAINNLREDAHRLVMRALAASGRRSDALRHYENVAALLKHELNVEPDASTKAIANDMRKGDGVPAAPSPTAPPVDPPVPNDRVSIAVLPFTNMSGDPEQEYFADGMAEEILTALSHCQSMLVIARNSTFAYKGKAVDIRQVGRELGVRYVLEGSVRRGGERVRFTGQLIDAMTGNHIWADRFEGDMTDVFALQDQFSESVVACIEPRLQLAEIERLKHKPAGDLNAYDCVLRAQQLIYEWTAESVASAMNHLEQALKIDANYALANAMLANAYATRRFQGWSKDYEGEAVAGLRLADRAVELGRDDGEVLWRAGNAMWHLSMQPEGPKDLLERALHINPNSSIALTIAGWIELALGNPDAAVELLQRAQRLSPRDPRAWTISGGMAFAAYQRGNFPETIAWAQKALWGNPRFAAALWFLAAAFGRLGETQKAAGIIASVLKVEPSITISGLRARTMYTKEEIWLPLAADLRAAGMPD
jgi:TolB-like protein/DNA-binding SARP family transcriptional activator